MPGIKPNELMVAEMDNKELFALIEEYGKSMQEFGRLNTGILSNPDRTDAFIKACKLVVKIEREILIKTDAQKCGCCDFELTFTEGKYCSNCGRQIRAA